jgi:RND family efflux transporter MFP subunit
MQTTIRSALLRRSAILKLEISQAAQLAPAAFLLAAVLPFSGCHSSTGSAQAGPPAMPVQTQIAETQTIADSTNYLAIVKSRHSAAINPQVEGQIVKIFVKSGDHVTAGTPLLQIDPLKQEAAVSGQEAARLAQEANVRQAKINLSRAIKLSEAGVISKADYDNAQSSYDAAVAQLKSLEEQVNQQKAELRYYRVAAPMNGVVGDIPVHVGDRVAVTTLLTTVDEPGALEAYIYVPAARAGQLKLGLPVNLLDESGMPLTQTALNFISPQVDNDTQTVLAKAPVGNVKIALRISQQVRAQITWSVHQGTVVPILAVQRINGEYFVFVASKEAQGTIARQRLLKLGEIIGNYYPVLSGLPAGEHVVVSGAEFLQDGAPVTEKVVEPKKSTTIPGAVTPTGNNK